MPLIRLTAPSEVADNPFFGLTDAQMRSVQEPEKGFFVAEGPKVVRTALELGYTPLAVMMRERAIASSGADILARCGDIPVYTGSDDVLAAITGFRLQRAWVLCALRRPPQRRAEEVIQNARRLAVLEGINEPSNLGSIFRSAAALGMDGVLLTPSCCDVLHRRAVRVCMGGVLRLPWAYVPLDRVFALLKDHGFTSVGMALHPRSVPLDAPQLQHISRLALFLGTEDTGLTDAALAGCDRLAVIPMFAGVDSLNVGAAAAVAFWQLRNETAPQP